MIVVMIWVYALMMIIPTMLGQHGTFGFNEEMVKCGYVNKDGVDPKIVFYSIGFGLPAILIVASYFGIWMSTTKSSSFLKLNS